MISYIPKVQLSPVPVRLLYNGPNTRQPEFVIEYEGSYRGASLVVVSAWDGNDQVMVGRVCVVDVEHMSDPAKISVSECVVACKLQIDKMTDEV